MANKYSPYAYVDLSPEKWVARSDELYQEEKQSERLNGRYTGDPAQKALTRLQREIILELFKYPDELVKKTDSQISKNVCVIGGGIAGLTAAYELVIRGHNVTLL